MNRRAKVRGGLSPPIIIGALLLLLCLELFAVTRIGTASAEGVWKDLDSDYYIVFDPSTQTYRETTYNMPRPYTTAGDYVVLTGVDGQQSTVTLKRNYGSRVLVILNGEERLMHPVAETPKLSYWSLPPKAEDCVAVYSSKLSFGETAFVRLYNDRTYVLKHVDDSDVQGKYYVGNDMSLLLFPSEKSNAEVLRPWSFGYVAGAVATHLQAQTLKANAIADKGILLEGFVRIPEVGVTYEFFSDNTVVRTLTTGESISMLYFVDTEGLVTMSDMLGSNSKDYMWYDMDSGTMYRYVFENDDWFDYLGKTGGAT